jgi:hydroxysqualene synthase
MPTVGRPNGDIIRRRMSHAPAEIEPARPAPGPQGAHSLREAQEFCATLVSGHYENFPVASRLLPASIRPAVQAIYAFARIADDFADEPAYAGRRLERLDEWGRMLEDCFRGDAIHPVFIALREAIRRHGLPADPFRDLLEAFRLDVTCSRYPDFASLLRYCRLSANPVGRLVLLLFGHDDPVLVGRSNAICTALQLTNHWQDVAVDLAKDRIYLPLDERADFGVSEEDLRAGRVTDGFRGLMAEQISRTRSLYATGRPLCDAVRGRLRLELRLTWLGGQRVLSQIEAAGYDVFARRPRLGAFDALALLGKALAWAA